MRILHVISRLNVGGTSRWLETLTAEQLGAGDEVLVAAGHVQGVEPEDSAAMILPLKRISAMGRAISPLADLSSVREVRDLIGDWRPDVVNTHTSKAGLVGRVAARSFGGSRPAIVHTVHGHLLEGYYSGPVARGIAAQERMMASVSDLILAAGEKVRSDLIAAGIAPAAKVVAVRPGVRDGARMSRVEARQQLGLTSTPAGRAVAGWLARIERIKRPDRLAGAAMMASDADVVVGGDGSLRRGLEEHAPRNLRSLGWVDPSAFWPACDFALLTSDNEAMPYSLIEAALAGLPAVTTDAGSAREVVVHGVTGLVVPRSAEAVAEGIRTLASDPVSMVRMGVAARQRALDVFSPHQMLVEHDRAYDRAATARLR